MRCPDCSKFVSFDTDVEPEEQSTEVEGSNFTATFQRTLTCAECGTELKGAEIELEYDFSGELDGLDDSSDDSKPKKGEPKKEVHEHEWVVESCAAEPTTDSKTVDRNGKRITNPRYMATLYGVHLDVELKCEVEGCDETITFEVSGNVEASSMDEMT